MTEHDEALGDNFEAIGRALVETIEVNAPDYVYGCCPSEIVVSLIDERDELKRQLDALASSGTPPVTADVSEIRGGEEHDGPLESMDLFVVGRGVSLLANVPAGSRLTYALSVDGRPQASGTVDASSGALALELLAALKECVAICDTALLGDLTRAHAAIAKAEGR